MMKQIMIRNLFVFFLGIGLLAVSTSNAAAAPGDADYTFGFLGVKIDSDSIYKMYPFAIAQQRDGKLLVAGYYNTETYDEPRLLLRRYNSNGAVDFSFGLSGFAVVQQYPSIISIYGSASDLKVQTDGKIIVAGRDYLGNAAVWRFNSSGALDEDFGNEGKVVFSAYATLVETVIYQGKILVKILNSSTNTNTLKRLNADGSIDSSFGLFGGAVIGLDSTYCAFVVNQVNGKITVGGSQNLTPALQHFTANGFYDLSYGSDNGIVSVPLSADCGTYTMTPHWFSSLDLQSDGKLIAAASVNTIGGCNEPYCYGNAIVRLHTNDTLDASYGVNGFAAKCNGRVNDAEVKLLPDGSNRILARLGEPITDPSSTNNFRRYSSTGSLNLIFYDEHPTDFLAQRTDGKIVTVRQWVGESIRLARYLP